MADKPLPKSSDKPATDKPSLARPEEKPAAPGATLAPASESSDPEVHQVLAEIQTARSNDNTDEVERLTEKLNDLGYE